MTAENMLVGYIHGSTVHAAFHHCLTRDTIGNPRILGHRSALSSANISFGRNIIVREFLKQDRTDWLLMLDTDMIWDPGTFDRMMEVADADEVPVLGALAFGMESYGEISPFPTIYSVGKDGNGNYHYVRVRDFPEDTLCPVAGTGAAFLLVHRAAFESVPERDGDQFRWFAEERIEGHAIGEDLIFCRRLGEAGIPIHVHTGIGVGHLKTVVADLDLFHLHRKMHSLRPPKE